MRCRRKSSMGHWSGRLIRSNVAAISAARSSSNATRIPSYRIRPLHPVGVLVPREETIGFELGTQIAAGADESREPITVNYILGPRLASLGIEAVHYAEGNGPPSAEHRPAGEIHDRIATRPHPIHVPGGGVRRDSGPPSREDDRVERVAVGGHAGGPPIAGRARGPRRDGGPPPGRPTPRRRHPTRPLRGDSAHGHLPARLRHRTPRDPRREDPDGDEGRRPGPPGPDCPRPLGPGGIDPGPRLPERILRGPVSAREARPHRAPGLRRRRHGELGRHHLSGADPALRPCDGVGEAAFRRGLRAYLREHSYGNARTEDLWRALEAASGKPVRAVMGTWTRQTGFPLLEVQVTRKNGEARIALSQARFLYGHILGQPRERTTWKVPVHVARAGQRKPTSFLMEKPKASQSLGRSRRRPDDDWIKVNAGQSGFYRVNYPAEEWARLRRAVAAKELDTSDRIGLHNDAYDLTRAGYLPATTFLELTSEYRDEDDVTAWRMIA